jgi:hypothetical protein
MGQRKQEARNFGFTNKHLATVIAYHLSGQNRTPGEILGYEPIDYRQQLPSKLAGCARTGSFRARWFVLGLPSPMAIESATIYVDGIMTGHSIS